MFDPSICCDCFLLCYDIVLYFLRNDYDRTGGVSDPSTDTELLDGATDEHLYPITEFLYKYLFILLRLVSSFEIFFYGIFRIRFGRYICLF